MWKEWDWRSVISDLSALFEDDVLVEVFLGTVYCDPVGIEGLQQVDRPKAVRQLRDALARSTIAPITAFAAWALAELGVLEVLDDLKRKRLLMNLGSQRGDDMVRDACDKAITKLEALSSHPRTTSPHRLPDETLPKPATDDQPLTATLPRQLDG